MGGGIFSRGGTVTLVNDTFTGNSAQGGPGGAGSSSSLGSQGVGAGNAGYGAGGGVLVLNSQLYAIFNTFTLNSVTTGPGGAVDGPDVYLYSADGSANGTLINNILGQDGITLTADVSSGLQNNVDGGSLPTFNGSSNNLVSLNGNNGLPGGDYTTGQPLLGPLASNGGPTQTFQLQAGSPAIAAGVAAFFPGTLNPITTEQRGTTRKSPFDIGSLASLTTPTLTAISPIQGPTNGGTLVTLTGSNFTGATEVDFGITPGTNLTVVNETTITVDAPAQSPGTVDITVLTLGGTSSTSAADQFSYIAAPSVTSITPFNETIFGGNQVTINGTSFAGATAVYFGSTEVTSANFVSASPTQIVVDSPPGVTGSVDITVDTPYGTSETGSADLFDYQAPALNVTPTTLNLGSTLAGTPSAGTTSYQIGGSFLAGDITIAATDGIEVSDDGGTTWHSTLTLPEEQGSMPTTTIDVRMNSTFAGPVDGDILNNSPGVSEEVHLFGNVLPAAASQFIISGLNNQIAEVAQNVTVKADDAYGNVATDYTGRVHFTSSDLLAVLPSDATLTEGTGTFPVTLKTAGSQSVTATDTLNNLLQASQTGLLITPAAAATLQITPQSTNGLMENVTVDVFDAYGNVATGYTGTVHFSSCDVNASLPADATLTEGIGNFGLTFSGNGIWTVTASDTQNVNLTGTSTVTLALVPSQGSPVVASIPVSYYGQSVTLTTTFSATEVGSSALTGTVSFYDGNTFLQSVPLVALSPVGSTVSGQASLSLTTLGVGTHSIRAIYSGDTNYDSANSTTSASVQVQQTSTATRLTASTTAQRTVLTAATSVTSAGDPSLSGAVSFHDGSTFLGSAPLTAGIATLNVSNLPSGPQNLTATFSGGLNSTQATSTGTLTFTAIHSGQVYLDLNASGSVDSGETGLAGRVVFLDLKGDGQLDPGDPTATTDSNGNYTLIANTTGPISVLEATNQDTSLRYVVDQTQARADGTVNIGVVPFSPVAPVKVVPDPFSSNPSTDANTAYVQSLYRSVLGRSGSQDEVAGWLSRIQSGVSLPQVAVGFVNSLEHRQDEVNAYYEEFLHRPPDPSSSHWVGELMSGVSEELVAQAFLNAAEYQANHQEPTLFVQDLYLDVLGRQGSTAEINGWQASLSSGMSRASVVAGFVGSVEAIDQLIESDYVAYLHRHQEQASTSTLWTNLLKQPRGSASAVAAGILSSMEYRTKATSPETNP